MLKTRKSPVKKELNKAASNVSLRLKKNKSKDTLKVKEKHIQKEKEKIKDDSDQFKLKKKIENMQAPQLLIKAHYKGKKLSVPLTDLQNKTLKQLIEPFITRFEMQILRNSKFDPSSIVNWKTTGTTSILKDYYFQLNRPMSPFKGQIIDIEPIFKAKNNKMLQLHDFEILKCIGTGGFSKVFLARIRSTGKFYALKLMEKQGLRESGKQCVVTNQRDIMGELDHPRILKMQYAFETKGFVVFALEYCPGGQLFYYLRKVRRMSEQDARFCFVQILTAFQYLHSKKIVYRDVKPQNILIDADGHLKLADFGLSRANLGKDQLAYTYCGSPQYMAPEMLKKCGHSFEVDYYCLGALLYELITGNPPFYSRDVQKIYYSIEHQQIDFPSHVQISPELQMLLTGLLTKDPRRRLGSLGGIRQILSHPWVRKLKASDVLQGRVPTPIQIDLMVFNINQDEIGDAQQIFQSKLRHQQQMTMHFEPMFDDFYFSRQPSNVLDQINTPQSKLGLSSSKMNLTIKQKPKSRQKQLSKSRSKDLGSRQKQLKKIKSSKRLINQSQALIERGRKRIDKSQTRKQPIKKRQKPQSPKAAIQGHKMLKRVKSTDTLGKMLK